MDKKMRKFLNNISAKRNIGKSVVLALTVLFFILAIGACAGENPAKEASAKGMVRMLDLGSETCKPCKMMAPILVKLEKQYAGKAVIQFTDILKDREMVQRYRIQVMPTQIFFDREGNEVYRHMGFMSEADIIQQLEKMGVK